MRPVPLIGPDSTTPAARRRNSSGDAVTTCRPRGRPGRPNEAAVRRGVPARSSAARPATSACSASGRSRRQHPAHVGLVDVARRDLLAHPSTAATYSSRDIDDRQRPAAARPRASRGVGLDHVGEPREHRAGRRTAAPRPTSRRCRGRPGRRSPDQARGEPSAEVGAGLVGRDPRHERAASPAAASRTASAASRTVRPSGVSAVASTSAMSSEETRGSSARQERGAAQLVRRDAAGHRCRAARSDRAVADVDVEVDVDRTASGAGDRRAPRATAVADPAVARRRRGR